LKVEEGKPRIRRLLLVGVAVMAALAFAAPASAVTYGAPDENGHPEIEICALLALQAYPSATVTSTARPRSPRAKTTTVSATSATV
jgi:hypothetical protein